MKQEVELHLAAVAARYPRAVVDARVEKVFDGYKLPQSHPLLRECAAALRGLSLEPRFLASGGATDANIFAGHGIEAAVLGLGGSNFHTTREQLSLTNLVNGARFITALIAD